MATYFDELIQLHPIGRGEPLWKMKISWAEYEKLKEILRMQSVSRFRWYDREAALYYGEWYRREYVKGKNSKEDLCEGLGIDDSYGTDLLAAAEAGLRRLGLQVIRVNNEWPKLSALYQGGLPMNRIATEIKTKEGSSKWSSFFRALVWDEVDFSLLTDNDNRVIPARSTSLREFCEVLQQADGDITKAPFSPNGSMEWWSIVLQNFEAARKERKARNPFGLTWLIDMNDNRKTITTSFRVRGPRELTPEFLSGHRLEGSFAALGVLINGTPYPIAEFNETNGKFYSRRVDKVFGYTLEDNVDVVINDCGLGEKVLSSHSLTFSDPKVVTLDEGFRCHTLCPVRKLAGGECRIICTEDWECDKLVPELYKIGETTYKVFKTTPEIVSEEPLVLVSKENGRKVLDPEVPLSWTEIREGCALRLDIPTKERLYDAPGNVSFAEVSAEKSNSRCSVEYSSSNRRYWEDRPRLGVVRARIKHEGGESVDPVRFLNSGPLSAKCLKPYSKSECRLAITPGPAILEVRCEYAKQNADGSWTVRKEDLPDPRYVPFVFYPNQGKGDPFTVHFHLPFYGFQIFDYNGAEIENGSTIPLVDLDGYRYYLHLPDTLSITHEIKKRDSLEGTYSSTEDHPGQGQWMNLRELGLKMKNAPKKDELKYIYMERDDERGVSVTEKLANLTSEPRDIAFEGRLGSLFLYGSEYITSLMEKQSASLPKAEATIRVEGDSLTDPLHYHFKDFPYRLELQEGRMVALPQKGMAEYTGALYALPFNNPDSDPVQLPRIEGKAGCYSIPDAILRNPDTKWLVYGSVKGYVLPKSLNPDWINEEGAQGSTREEVLADIKAELKAAGFFDGPWERALRWFDIIQDGLIPGSSILELVAIADDRELMAKFALQLYIRNCRSTEALDETTASLIDFQTQMSTLWIWAADSLDIPGWIGSDAAALEKVSPLLMLPYVTWVLEKDGADGAQHLDASSEGFAEKFREYLGTVLPKQFKKWFKELRENGLPDQKYIYVDVHQNGGDEILSEGARFWFTVAQSQVPGNYKGDDLWKMERRKLSEMLKSMDIGGLADSEPVREEIKKSIIYGLKFKLTDEV